MFGDDMGDLAVPLAPGATYGALCEGCGGIRVDRDGKCLDHTPDVHRTFISPNHVHIGNLPILTQLDQLQVLTREMVKIALNDLTPVQTARNALAAIGHDLTIVEQSTTTTPKQ